MAVVFAFGDEYIRVPYLDGTDICLKLLTRATCNGIFIQRSYIIIPVLFPYSCALFGVGWCSSGGQRRISLRYKEEEEEERANG